MSGPARKVCVTGRVQGVFFRAWTRQQAIELGVNGWVRNCADGSVEAHLEGDDDAVHQLIERMRGGPPSAVVTNMQVSEAAAENLDHFELRH